MNVETAAPKPTCEYCGGTGRVFTTEHGHHDCRVCSSVVAPPATAEGATKAFESRQTADEAIQLDPSVNSLYAAVLIEPCENKPYANLFGIAKDGHKVPVMVLDLHALFDLADCAHATAVEIRFRENETDDAPAARADAPVEAPPPVGAAADAPSPAPASAEPAPGAQGAL